MLIPISRSTVCIGLLLVAAGCPSEEPPPVDGRSAGEVELPETWESSDNRLALRLTNSSSTSTEVRRALNTLVNSRIDPMTVISRGGLDVDAEGEPIRPEGSAEELLAGSATDQAKAFVDRVVNAEEDPFEEGTVTDSCGNPLLMATVAPNTLQHVLDGPQDLDVWSANCPDGIDCNTIEFGTLDVALGEARFDGMTNVTLHVFPDLTVEPIVPAFWGHLSGFFLTGNNPGVPWVSMFANVGQARVDIQNVLQLTNTYNDVAGSREVYAFPHRDRTLSTDEIAITLEPYSPTLDYWIRSDLSESDLGIGADTTPFMIETTSVVGTAIDNDFARPTAVAEQASLAFAYQLGATMVCPPITERGYLREGPVEVFLCPDGELEACIAEEDIEEGACLQPGDANFPIISVSGPTPNDTPIVVPPAQSPVYLSVLSLGLINPEERQVNISIDVNPDSVLYLLGEERILSVSGGVDVPNPLPNTHCDGTVARRYDVGSAWPAGTYTVTLSLEADPDGTPGSGDELVTSGDDTQLWVYFTSLDVWRP